MIYCKYYQARVKEKDCIFFIGILRSFEHLEFNRTIDTTNSILEFFVPEDNVPIFLQVMSYFKSQSIISDFKELPNRLKDSSTEL